ncbi:MAG TPA: LamG-like jellyroll fold domain-containing protein [Actinocrinis sp.]|nr:LamG-like jellyroll fold domain-containing protein [Actinocrinis sp.]
MASLPAPAASPSTPAPAQASDLLDRAWAARGERRNLPHDLLDLLERHLGADLTALRVHTGPAADAVARAFGADAVTCGSAIFFRDGCYRPAEPRGLRLVAHEAAHVVQQARGTGPLARPGARGGHLVVGCAHDEWEAEADRFADLVLADRGTSGAGAFPRRDFQAHGRRSRRTAVPAGPTRMAQCHASFEHRYLGDGPTRDLVAVSTKQPGYKDILETQIRLMNLWRHDPWSVTQKNITDTVPGIRTLLLGPDQVVATYGEVNALPDYLANAQAIEELPKGILMPILQVIRQESFNRFTALQTGTDPNIMFADAACAPWRSSLINNIVETRALDLLTLGLGPAGQDHYQGLLARNACHFAPYSWYRWSASHLQARDLAARAFRATGPDKERLTREALYFHGYGDHFLQDSFAAGHLTNKTLVMQWFVEWAEGQKLLPFADWDSLQYMTAGLQPALSGRRLYDAGYEGPSIDPQTVQEASDLIGRTLGNGVGPGRESGQIGAYNHYLTFLSSAVAQFGAASLHDYYNSNSVWAASVYQAAPFELWGDDTLFSGRNGGPGVEQASAAAKLSEKALWDILGTGRTDVTPRRIRDRFPTRAGNTATGVTDLESWATGQKAWCEEHAFAPFLPRLSELLLRLVSPRLGTVSRDQPLADQWYAGVGRSDTWDEAAVLAVGGRAFASADGYLYELAPTDGKVKQKIQLPDTSRGAVASLTADATHLYVGVTGRVHALPLGATWTKPQWTTGVLSGLTHDHPVDVLLVGARLFAGTNSFVHELRPADGRGLQEIELGSRAGIGDYDTKLASNGSSLLFVGTHGYAYALNLTSGWDKKHRWQHKVNEHDPIDFSPVTLLAHKNRLFAASNGYACEILPENGARVQFILLASKDGVGNYTTDLVTDGALLYAGTHGYVYALTLETPWAGAKKWTSPHLGGLLWHPVGLLYLNDRLVAACDGSVYDLDLFNGSIKSSAEAAPWWGLGDYTPTVTTDGTTLYVGSHGYVYRLGMSDLQPAPDGYWKLSQTSGTSVPDERADYPATASNVTWQQLPGLGGCAALAGNGAIGTAVPVLDTRVGRSYTVSAWVRLDQVPPQPTGTAVFVSQDANLVSAFSLEYQHDSKAWAFSKAAGDVPNPITYSAQARTPVSLGVWTHLTGVFDAAEGLLRLFVNGALAGTSPVPANHSFASTGGLVMGRGKYAALPVGWLRGAVRDVKVYAQALASPQIAPLATSFWPLADHEDSTTPDVGGTHPGRAAKVEWKHLTGVGGYADFNGRDSEVTTALPVLYTGRGSSFTVAAWVRINTLPPGAYTILSQDSVHMSGFALRYQTTNSGGWAMTRYAADQPGAAPVSALSGTMAAPGVWTHVTGVYDADQALLRIHVDGRLKGIQRLDPSAPFPAVGAMVVGRGKIVGTPAERLNGAVRDARAYPLALSAEQIKALVYQGAAGAASAVSDADEVFEAGRAEAVAAVEQVLAQSLETISEVGVGVNAEAGADIRLEQF